MNDDNDGEETSRCIRAIAARGLADPTSLTPEEVQAICGSALTQAPDHDDEPPPGAHSIYK
jgi:hypothetical protein